MSVTFFIWLKALEKSKNFAKTGNFIYLTPFISLIFIHFIVGERIYFSTIIGLTLIVLGIISNRDSKFYIELYHIGVGDMNGKV